MQHIRKIVVACAAFLFGALIIYRTLVFGDPVAGYPSLMVTMLFLGGVQLIALGVIGEYLGRVFNETKRRPLYVIQEYTAPAYAELNRPGAKSPLDLQRPSCHGEGPTSGVIGRA